MSIARTETGRTVLRSALSSQKGRLVGSAALFMSWQACESLVPVLIGVVIDEAIAPGDGTALVTWLVVLAALFLVLSLSFRFGSRLGRAAAERSAHQLRLRVADAVLHPLAEPDGQRTTGAIVSVAGSDTQRMAQFCATVVFSAGAVTSVVVAAVVVLRIDLLLGLVVLVGGPVLVLVMHWAGRPLERRAGHEQESAAQAAALATDLVTGLRVLKGIGGERAAVARYRIASRHSLVATLRSARAEGGFEAVTLLLPLLFLAVVTLVGGRLAAEGRIEIGELVAAGGVAQFLLGPFGQLSESGSALARARASAARIADVLNTPRQPMPTAPQPAPHRGALRMPLGEGHSLDVPAGQMLGVVADGSEAGSFVDALAAARRGEVRVDGVRPADLSSEDAARTLLVARHDATLFSESLHDNVSGGRAELDIEPAMLAADADEVARALPDGARTVLGEQGRTLSGGQRQRVALARALAVDPLVLVLHDPTTAVDGVTEARIAGGLRELRRRTTIVVTTSPALLAVCDRVVVVRGSAVVADGQHARLAADDAWYRELVLA